MLDFSDLSFSQFFAAELGIDIGDLIYAEHGGAKGKRLRCFLQKVDDALDRQILLKAVLKRKVRRAAATGGPFTQVEGRPSEPSDVLSAIAGIGTTLGLSAYAASKVVLSNLRILLA